MDYLSIGKPFITTCCIPNFVIIQSSWDIIIKVEVANNGPENNDACVGLCRSYTPTLSPKTTFAQE